MTKEEFLKKYDNKKPYGWVCFMAAFCGGSVNTSVLAIGMTKNEAKENAVELYGKSIVSNKNNIYYEQVTEAAYRKLKTAQTMKKFRYSKYEGVSVTVYDET